MKDDYLVSKWALIRRNELVDIPDKLEIHPDFLKRLSHEEFESAFREVGGMFYRMYSDMAGPGRTMLLITDWSFRPYLFS